MKKLLILFLFVSVNLLAQKKDPNEIIQKVIQKFDKIHDYQADMEVKLDVSFAKIPDTKAKIYFKQPDKVKVESKGFALLPRNSVNFSPSELLKGDYTALYVKSETEDNHNLDVIKIIPSSDSTDIILSTLWVDEDYSLVRKVVTNGKRSGTTTITLSYDDPAYSLPSKINFAISIGTGDNSGQDQPQTAQQPQQNQNRGHRSRFNNISGNIIVTYSNYKINQGIPDSIFEKKDGKE